MERAPSLTDLILSAKETGVKPATNPGFANGLQRPVSSDEDACQFVYEDFDVTEDEGHYHFSTDLPGVKADNVQLEICDGVVSVVGNRTRKGATPMTCKRKLAVDDHVIDASKLSATLSEGVLTIHAAKKKVTGPVKVCVVAADPPEDEPELSLEIDIPGVKAGDLDVVLSSNGELSVSGQRRRGRGPNTKQAYMINTRKIDTSRMEAYLVDGVLYIRAPAKKMSKAAIPVYKTRTNKMPSTAKMPSTTKTVDNKIVPEEKEENSATTSARRTGKKNKAPPACGDEKCEERKKRPKNNPPKWFSKGFLIH
jgi:HSP20 family molecular chaperone IbpA